MTKHPYFELNAPGILKFLPADIAVQPPLLTCWLQTMYPSIECPLPPLILITEQ
jgi:hypothetical protein